MTTMPLKFANAEECLNLWRMAMRLETQQDVKAFDNAMRSYACLFAKEQNAELLAELKHAHALLNATDGYRAEGGRAAFESHKAAIAKAEGGAV